MYEWSFWVRARLSEKLNAVMVGFSALTLSACDSGSKAQRGPSPDDFPQAIDVSAQKVVEGFAIGTIRESRDVDAFRITKSPVTVAEFRRCVVSGACAPPPKDACAKTGPGILEGPDYDNAADAVPVTCVGLEQAQAYCGWLGGTLPGATQWLAASRGPDVHRFSWGDQLASCEQHPRGFPPDDPKTVGLALPRPLCNVGTGAFDVGTHPGGRSPAGLEDVLTAPAELLAPSEQTSFGSCSLLAPACLVNGMLPGAIDFVAPLPVDANGKPRATDLSYTFRCAWNAGGSSS